MENRKHLKARLPRKTLLLLVSLIFAVIVGVGGTIAYIFTQTDESKNVFTPADVSCDVIETFEDNVKSNVSIQNTGKADAFIRVAINITWMKDDNASDQTVTARVPVKDVDYSIEFANSSDWIKGTDGYWYYKTPVAPNENTKVLIDKCQLTENASVPQGYHLSVEVISSAIQSSPTSVVEEKWNVETRDGIIVSVNKEG